MILILSDREDDPSFIAFEILARRRGLIGPRCRRTCPVFREVLNPVGIDVVVRTRWPRAAKASIDSRQRSLRHDTRGIREGNRSREIPFVNAPVVQNEVWLFNNRHELQRLQLLILRTDL